MLMVRSSAAAATASIIKRKSSLSLTHDANIQDNIFHISTPSLATMLGIILLVQDSEGE